MYKCLICYFRQSVEAPQNASYLYYLIYLSVLNDRANNISLIHFSERT